MQLDTLGAMTSGTQTSGARTPSSTDGSGVLIPYNAPAASDFNQVLQAVTPAPQPAAQQMATTPSASAPTPLPPMPLPASAATAGTTAGLPSTATAMPSSALPSTMVSSQLAGTGDGDGCCCCCCGGMHRDTSMPMLSQTAMGGSMVPVQRAMAAYGAQGTAATGMAVPAGAAGQTPASAPATTPLSLPVPSSAPVTQPFGPTSFAAEPAYNGYSHFHTGIDYGVPVDTPIAAAAGGRVVSAGWDNTGFGNCIVIDHGKGLRTLYGHLDKIEVTVGQTVQAGQEIAQSGSTGNSTGPHLHFGVEKNGQWVDPAPFLKSVTPVQAATAPASTAPVGTLPASTTATTTTTTQSTGLAGLVQRASAATGVPTSLIRAVVQAESNGDPHAVSRAGAKGLMQLMDATAASYGVSDPFDPQQNVMGGSRYLRNLLDKYHGNVTLAVAAYNAGPAAVDQYNGIPPYPETQQYVQRVLGLQQHYGQSTAT